MSAFSFRRMFHQWCIMEKVYTVLGVITLGIQSFFPEFTSCLILGKSFISLFIQAFCKDGLCKHYCLEHLSEWYIYIKNEKFFIIYNTLSLSFFYVLKWYYVLDWVIHPFRNYLLSSYCMTSCSRGWWEVFILCWTLDNIVLLS